MFATASPTSAYKSVDLESRILSASPHGLVSILFSEALTSILCAKNALDAHDVETKGKHARRAVDIVNQGLAGSLDMTAGELSENLSSLYAYVVKRILWSSLKDDPAGFDEAAFLLEEIFSAWRDIAPEKSS